MINTLTLLLVVLSLSCCTGQRMESIPSSSVVKRPGETLSLSCRGSGFTFSCCGMNWIRQPAGKGLEWLGFIWYDARKAEYTSSVQGRIEISRDNSNSMTYLRLSNLQPEDSAVYYCARQGSGAFDYWGKGTTVTVTSATSTGPTVFPLIQCGAQDAEMITLGCLATGFTPSSLTFSWTKNNAALTDFIKYPPVQKNNLYSAVSQIQVRRQDWNQSETVKCVATHAAGNAQGDIRMPTVIYQLPTVKVCSSSDEEDEVSFSCVAKDFSPKTHEIKWLKNGNEVTDQKDEFTAPPAQRQDSNGNTVYSSSSFLSVQPTEWTPGTIFTCVFKGKGENNVEVFKNASVTYKEELTGNVGCREADVDVNIVHPTLEDLFLKRKGTVICQVQVHNGRIEKILWQDENKTDMAGAFMVPPKGKKGTFSLPLEITYDEWAEGKKRHCIVESEDWYVTLKKTYERNIDFMFETNNEWNAAIEAEEDTMAKTAITFILLFLITLIFTIGATAVKVK